MNRILELRQLHNWTQKDLAERLNTSQQAIGRYENEDRGLSIQIINTLCDLFHVSADYLLCRSDIPSSQLTEAEWQLLAAYRAASLRDRGLVDQILAPYIQVAEEKDSAI